MLYLLLRFLPIVLFISFLIWLKYRKQNPMQGPDKALRYWFWAMVVTLGITITSLVLWALEQKQSLEAQQYNHHEQAD